LSFPQRTIADPEIALGEYVFAAGRYRKPIPFSALKHLTTLLVRSASADVERSVIANKKENVPKIPLRINRLPVIGNAY